MASSCDSGQRLRDSELTMRVSTMRRMATMVSGATIELLRSACVTSLSNWRG